MIAVGLRRAGMAVVALLVCAAAHSEPDIRANALFDGRAMLTIDGQPRMLRPGQRSQEGVTLVSSSSREAVIEYDGQRRTLTLSREIGASYAAAHRRQLAIPRSQHGQYRVGGAINGHQTPLLVDTGANVVALSGEDAKRMGIDYRAEGTPTSVQTAGGVVQAWAVVLDRVDSGGILVRNVQATVIEGAHPSPPLLGMSWLSRVSMREDQGVLYLQER